MNVSSTSISVFIVITLVYYGFLLFLPSNVHLVLHVIYILLTISIQTLFSSLHLRTMCGSVRIKPLIVWSIIPWFFIFLSIKALLMLFPSWKMPFSNTIGYLVVSLLGINRIMTSLLKSKFKTQDEELNKVISNIFEDKTLLINQFTPTNFDSALEKISKILDKSNTQYEELVEQLRFRVQIKDYISQFIWLLLTGLLTISISNMGILSTECVKSAEEIEGDVLQYEQQLENAIEDKPKVYKIRD